MGEVKTARERVIAERRAQIKEIEKEQAKLIKEASKLLRKPWRRSETFIRRMDKVVQISCHIQHMEFRKHLIVSAPIPKAGPAPLFMPGGKVYNGPAIVGDLGREVITLKDGSTIEIGKEFTPVPPKFDPLMFPKLSEYVKQGDKEG